MKKKNNHFYGKKHTLATRKLMRQNHVNVRGKNNPGYIDGRTLKKYFCGCGKEINKDTALYRGGKCPSCCKKGNLRSFKNGRAKDGHGYVKIYLPKHPKNNCKYVLEHRLVMEKKLGRKLKRHEIIHHLNGIRNDNRVENLMLVTRKTHEGHTFIHQLQKQIRELEQTICNLRKIKEL